MRRGGVKEWGEEGEEWGSREGVRREGVGRGGEE